MNDLIESAKAGCGSHSCRRHKPKGMGVNGPCRCWAMVDELVTEIERLTADVKFWRRNCEEHVKVRAQQTEDLESQAAEIKRLQRAYRPPDLVEYNALQDKVEELECSLTISRKKHVLSIAKVYELERLLDFAEQELPHDVACPDECLKCACAKAATEQEDEGWMT